MDDSQKLYVEAAKEFFKDGNRSEIWLDDNSDKLSMKVTSKKEAMKEIEDIWEKSQPSCSGNCEDCNR